MSDDELTDVVANMDDYVLKSCLEHLSENDLADILKRTDNLSGQIAAFQLDDKGNTKKSEIFDNRYEYLFSDEFSDYCISAKSDKVLTGTLSSGDMMGFDGSPYKVKYDGATLTIKVGNNGTANTIKVTLESDNSSKICFKSKDNDPESGCKATRIASFDAYRVNIDWIYVNKIAHKTLKKGTTYTNFNINADDSFTRNNCEETFGAFGVNIEYNAVNKLICTIEQSNHGTNYTDSIPSDVYSRDCLTWMSHANAIPACERYSGTCVTRTYTCKNCKKQTDTENIYTTTANPVHDAFKKLDGSWNIISSDANGHTALCIYGCGRTVSMNHSMETILQSTCKSQGYMKCKDCGWTKYLSLLAHTSSGLAGCVTDSTCTRCGDLLDRRKGHTNDNFSWETSTLSGTGAKFPSTYSSGTPSVETGDYTLSDGNKVHVSTVPANTGLGVTVPNGQRFVQCTRGSTDDNTCNSNANNYQYAVIPAVASSSTANKAISSVSTAVYGSQGGKVKVTATPKTGYHFTGWYTDEKLTDKVYDKADYDIFVSSNPIQLYADGEINKNKVKVVIPTPGSSTVTWEQPADTSTTTWSTLDGVPCCEGEYQKSVSFPTPTAVGYVFAGWDVTGTGAGTASYTTTGITTYSFGTGDDTVAIMTATWKPRTDTKLSIDVYTQDLNYQWDVYTKVDTLIYTGTTDSVVNTSDLITYAFKKENLSSDYYKYLRNNKGDTVTIGADGRTRIEIYYARIKHTVKINGASSKLKADISLSSQTKQTVPSSSSGDVTTWTVYAGDTCTVTITPYTSERERYDHYIERVKRIESVNGAAVSYSLTGEDLAPYIQDDGAFVYQMSDIIKDMQFDYEIYGRPEIRIGSRLSSNAKASPWTADVMYTVTGTTNLGKKVTYSRIISGETDTALTVDPGVYLIYAETAYRWNITTDAGTAVELDVSDGAEVSDAGGHKDAVFDVDVKDWSKFSDSATYILDLK